MSDKEVFSNFISKLQARLFACRDRHYSNIFCCPRRLERTRRLERSFGDFKTDEDYFFDPSLAIEYELVLTPDLELILKEASVELEDLKIGDDFVLPTLEGQQGDDEDIEDKFCKVIQYLNNYK